MHRMFSFSRSLTRLVNRSYFGFQEHFKTGAFSSVSNAKYGLDNCALNSHEAFLTLSITFLSSFKRRAFSMLQSSNSTISVLPNNVMQQSLCQPSQLASGATIPHRNVIMIGYDGKKHNDQRAVDRFRRLGNGLWLRKQRGDVNIWKKFMVRRKPWKVFRSQQIVICNKWQSKLLDKMTTRDFQKQKWYVDDLYKGYTEESLFYYHPKDLPWNTLKLPKDHYKYAVKRYRRGNKLRRHRRRMHKHVLDSYQQKPLPNTKDGFCFA